MAIDRNTIVSIPETAYVEKDQTVFVKDVNVYDPIKKYYQVKHTIIGRCISEGKMYPNTNYARRYPLLYEQASGQKLRRRTMNIGFYISVLSIVSKLHLYDILEKCFGIENANMILDFSMYSMIYHSCVSDQYPSAMKDQMIFSSSIWSPSKLSAFFKQEFTEPRVSEFKRLWAQNCMERGTVEVWIAIDGSNNDCQVSETKLSEHGKSKSHKDLHVVSYMYIVDAVTGDPIAIFIYRGGRVDCKAVMEVIGWLKAYNMQTKGAIVDRGFATEDVFKEFDRNGIDYVAMLKGNSLAHTEMLSHYADKIRMKYEYMLGKYRQDRVSSCETIRKDSPVLYGISSREKIKTFASHSYKAYAHLIYDRLNGGELQDLWYRKVTEKAYSLQSDLNAGNAVKIPDEFKDCIIKTVVNGKPTILVNERQVQSTGDKKGYFTLASSSKMEAEEANGIYSLRNSSEEIYSMLKSQIGADVTGVQGDDSITAKLVVAFITSIIRNEILKTAKSIKIPTNKIIKELDNIKIYLDNEDKYYVCHTENQREIDFLNYWDFKTEMLDGLAVLLNERASAKEPTPHHRLPEYTIKERRGPGRPKGAKNILPKVKANDSNQQDTPKRRRGRPKGAKNKKTIEKEALVVKRGPGRPKGARNKPKPTGEVIKRKRGRPRKEKI